MRPESARLRHRQTAALGAGAAHDVGERVRAGGAETRRLQPLIEVLERRRPCTHRNSTFCPIVRRAVPSLYASARSASTCICPAVMSPSGRRTVTCTKPGLPLKADVGVHPAEVRVGERLQLHRPRHDAGTVHLDAAPPCRFTSSIDGAGGGSPVGRLLRTAAPRRLEREAARRPPRAPRRAPRRTSRASRPTRAGG